MHLVIPIPGACIGGAKFGSASVSPPHPCPTTTTQLGRCVHHARYRDESPGNFIRCRVCYVARSRTTSTCSVLDVALDTARPLAAREPGYARSAARYPSKSTSLHIPPTCPPRGLCSTGGTRARTSTACAPPCMMLRARSLKLCGPRCAASRRGHTGSYPTAGAHTRSSRAAGRRVADIPLPQTPCGRSGECPLVVDFTIAPTTLHRRARTKPPYRTLHT